MISFDLKCGSGHVFEAWFGSSDDYEEQRKASLIACPLCDGTDIEKAVMAPNVSGKSNRRPDAAPADRPMPVAAGAEPNAAQMKQALAALAKAQADYLAKSEDVGSRFAEEARRIHEGESVARAIHGEATTGEARALHQDGIDVMPLPLPVRRKMDA